MSRLSSLAALVLIACAPEAAQQTPAPRTFQTLRSQVTQVQTMRGVLEIQAKWTPAQIATATKAATPDTFSVTSQSAKSGTLRRERRPELSADHLVVVVLNQDGVELDWRIVADPRVLRTEVPGPDGRLSGGSVKTNATELMLTIPDLAGARRVAIYEPHATADGGYDLTMLGRLELNAR